jgi:predicted HTH transcriptional regulator
VRFKDTEFIRVGSHKQRLREHEGKERRLWAIFSATCFEEGIAATGLSADEVFDRLDYSAFFRLLKEALPENKSGMLTRLQDYRLVARQGADRFDVTNLGAILFARDLARFGRLGRKAIRVIKYAGLNRLFTEKEWTDVPARTGYAAGFDAAVAYINSQLPSNEHIGQALRQNVPMYPEIAIRELTANLLIHQDFTVGGAGPTVEIFDDRIEFTNPGEPLVDPQRFIDMPPRSRNEELARLMRLLTICEERGSGIDKVVAAIEMFQLPPPDFRKPAGSTQAVLFAPRKFADMDPAERIRACYQHCVLCWVGNVEMTNTTLRNRLGIEAKNYRAATRIIAATVVANLIKSDDPKNDSRKYVPFWA